MLRQLRRKLASSISIIQGEEDFLYNTWLRKPQHKSVAIGTIISRFLETSHISFYIEPPFFSAHFFALGETTVYPEDLKYLFKKVGTNAVFFQLLYVPSKVTYHADIEPRPAGYSAKKVDFILSQPSERDVSIKFKSHKPNGYLFLLSSPEIKDHLDNLKPKVLKIDMLNVDELKNDTTKIKGARVDNFGTLKFKKVKVDSIKKPPKLLKVKIPGMGTYKSKVSGLELSQLFTPDISKKDLPDFTQPTISVSPFDFRDPLPIKDSTSLPDNTANSPGKMVDELSDQGKSSDVLKLLLKKTIKVDWAQREESKIKLTKFENTGAKFLAENSLAFLAEEPGLETVKETLAALKFLFLSKVVRSALIVLPAGVVGNEEKSVELASDLGWLGRIAKYCPELPYIVVKGEDEERTECWNKSSAIYVVDHDTFVRDYNLNILDKKTLSKFECIVIDEIRDLMEKPAKTIGFLKEINPDVLWALSSTVKDDIQTALNKSLNNRCQIEAVLMRHLSDVTTKEFRIKHDEFWLEPDEYQKVEYKETIVNCRKELKRVLESGNPFRYQSNISILLHKIFQVENFAHGYESSPKSDLLIQHLHAMKNNKQKVIVTSQYDRQGTKKLERLLDQHKINYVTVPASLSADETKKAIKLFKDKNTVTVFLTNAKLSRLNFGKFFVPYIIRFDSWWNPAQVSQMKDLFEMDEEAKSQQQLVVYTYKMFSSIDEGIKKTLMGKDLLEDNIINVMPTNTINDLISVEEWLKVFEMPVEEDHQKSTKLFSETVEAIVNHSIADYRATLSRFFHTLGYTHIDILEHENSASFDIIGRGKDGKQEVDLYCNVFLDDVVKKKEVKQIAVDASLLQNRNTFIITRGKFEKGCDALATGNLKLLDTERLAHYIVTLNIMQTQQVGSA